MGEQIQKKRLTEIQPWRGIFGLIITLGLAFVITSIFTIETFNGIFTFVTMSMVPVIAIMGMVWKGQYPPTGNLHQVWRGLSLTLLLLIIGTIFCFILLNFHASGIVQPFIAIILILSIVLIFFHIIVWGTFPWHKISTPANGFLALITAYVLGVWIFSYLFNFDLLSYPTGTKPSPIGSVPFYAQGGPLFAFSHFAPRGPIPWESALCFTIWAMVPLWILVHLGMWPFAKYPSLMNQPAMGIVITLTCCIIAYFAYVIGVSAMNIEPIKFMVIAISYIFGLLMLLTVFQTWPGTSFKGPVGGFVNAICSVPIGIAGYYGILAFCNWHFGPKAMVYPNNLFAIGGVMLGVTFPMWVVYTGFWDFWPLPPSPPVSDPSNG